MNDLAFSGTDDSAIVGHGNRPTGAVRIGSADHLRLFCLELLETHDPYRPAVIQWPALSAEELQRVTALPIWNMAVQKEGYASMAVESFARTITDPLLRRAIDMDAAEERRHKEVLSKLVAAYGIPLEPEPAYPAPKNPRWGWLAIGYGECIDSFFAFGLFESARRSGFFPPELVETFEPVMQEEGRHILFFVNWAAWYRRTLPWWRRPWFVLTEFAVWMQLIRERIKIARSVGAGTATNDLNFTATGGQALGAALRPRDMLALCLAENDRRLSRYDARLLRPRIVPALARLALKLL